MEFVVFRKHFEFAAMVLGGVKSFEEVFLLVKVDNLFELYGTGGASLLQKEIDILGVIIDLRSVILLVQSTLCRRNEEHLPALAIAHQTIILMIERQNLSDFLLFRFLMKLNLLTKKVILEKLGFH